VLYLLVLLKCQYPAIRKILATEFGVHYTLYTVFTVAKTKKISVKVQGKTGLSKYIHTNKIP
jgi:hypothetical protein